MTVAVQGQQAVVAIEAADGNIVSIQSSPPSTINVAATTQVTLEAFANGPQGAIGPQGEKGINLDETAKIDGSIIYYDAAALIFKADATKTIDLLTDGGNF